MSDDKTRGENEVGSTDLLALIDAEPYPEQWIFHDDGEWWVTTEWLVGPFAGRAFTASSKDEAAAQMVEYFNRHLGHDSIVGIVIRESGWPNLEMVREYTRAKSHVDSEANDQALPQSERPKL